MTKYRDDGGGGGGFTLIELSVVIFILGLALSFALPRIMSLEDVELKHSARRLSGTIRYLTDQAAYAKTLYLLTFDLKAGTYAVKYCLPERDPPHNMECYDDRNVLGKMVSLPNTVRFQDVVVMNQKFQPEDEGAAVIPFYPDGYIFPALIHLKDLRGAQYTLQVNPITGRVKILEGYVESLAQTPVQPR